MKRLFFSILWVVVTLVVFFLAIEVSSFFSSYSVKSDYAYIRPSEIVLNSPVQSTVASVAVQSSDKISAGDPLVVLNASDVDAEVRLIKSHIKSLKLKQDFLMSLINLNAKLTDFIDHAENDVHHLSPSLSDEVARLNAISSQKNHSASSAALVTYLNQLSSDELLAMDAKQAKTKILAKTQQFKLDYNQIQLDIDKSIIKLGALRRQREDYIVRSPWSGSVLSMITYPGEVVSRTQPLVVIRGHSLDYVDAYFSLSHVNQLFLGQKATITLKGDKKHRIKAMVTEIGLQNQRVNLSNEGDFNVFKSALPEEYLVVLRIEAVPDNMKSIFKPGVPVTVAMD